MVTLNLNKFNRGDFYMGIFNLFVLLWCITLLALSTKDYINREKKS